MTTSRPDGDPLGKRALYSAAVSQTGMVLLTCSSCEGSTRVGLGEFARAHFPVSAWIPPFRHWARCPACGHRTWLRASWLR